MRPARILIGVTLLALFAAACTGGGDDKPADAENRDATPTATGTASAEPSATSTADASQPSATATDGAAVSTLYIDGGGSGVAIRQDCEDAARTGDAWPDGTEVRVMQLGSGDCAGWSLVFAGSGSWVRSEYLSEERPASAVVASGGGGTPPNSGGGGGTSTTTPPTTSTPPSRPSAPLTFVSPAGVTWTSDDLLAGGAILRGAESGFQYLGLVSVSWTGTNSLCNPTGKYGSPASPTSVRNPNGEFGIGFVADRNHPFFNSKYSAYSAKATSPPAIVVDDVVVGFLSVRDDLTGAVHPDTLFFHLGCSY